MNNREIWEYLYKNQISFAWYHSSSKWRDNVDRLYLNDLPAIEDLHIPHWKIQPILGKSPEKPFWYRLSRGIFNVNLRLRDKDHLEYLEERDTFHDVFGHLPILFDKEYTDYVRALGVFAQFMQDTDEARRALSNIYWYTSEFGMVVENNTIVPYGAGIISSSAELKHAVEARDKRIQLNLSNLEHMASLDSYITDGFQERYYVLPNWEYLKNIIKWLWANYV